MLYSKYIIILICCLLAPPFSEMVLREPQSEWLCGWDAIAPNNWIKIHIARRFIFVFQSNCITITILCLFAFLSCDAVVYIHLSLESGAYANGLDSRTHVVKCRVFVSQFTEMKCHANWKTIHHFMWPLRGAVWCGCTLVMIKINFTLVWKHTICYLLLNLLCLHQY